MGVWVGEMEVGRGYGKWGSDYSTSASVIKGIEIE